MKTCDILIRNARVLKPDMTVAVNQFIAIRDAHIVETGDESLLLARPEQEQYKADTVIADGHILWMPGLTDAHLHTCLLYTSSCV